ncbi:hypothetical protein JS756_03530 [Streptomyces actuosus]|uniref:Tetracycline repressor TetR C-terminal domain-containing protein n=1 Tax=Streptomyces actuosus TaxID=1885 RepID=A0ABS2VJC1_STRAS|nr:hypothetical protein [Streptomyces actuosus]MBN0043189.1 hypothetical protein [Streptomyces actuosus]
MLPHAWRCLRDDLRRVRPAHTEEAAGAAEAPTLAEIVQESGKGTGDDGDTAAKTTERNFDHALDLLIAGIEATAERG